MFACVCWTPFQILNALNYKMAYKQQEKMDLFICRKFKQADEIGKKLQTLDYVNQVYFVDNLDYDSLQSFQRKKKILSDLFHIKSVIETCVDGKISLEELKYSQIVSSGFLNFNILFNNYFNKKGAESIFIDDGLESYLRENTADQYSAIYKLASKISGNGGTRLKPKELYVYMPEIVEAKEKYRKVGKLPSIRTISHELKKDLNMIFSYEHMELDAYKCLVFDQIGTGDFKNTEYLEIQMKILKALREAEGNDQLLIKMHPRAMKNIYGESYRTFSTSIPWEVFVMNEKMDDKILVSLSSTACFTPKLIFEEEPRVIFLYKLFQMENSDVIEGFINRVKGTYKKPQKILIPNDFQELMSILNTLKTSEER